MNEKEIALKYLDSYKTNIKQQIEYKLKCELKYYNFKEDTITVSFFNEHLKTTQTYLLKFKSKKIEVQNVRGTLSIGLNQLTKENMQVVIALYNQYKSLNHTYFIIKKN